MSFDENKTVLRSLIRYKKGFAFKSKDYIEDGVPVIRVSNFSGNSITPNDLKFVSNEIAIANKDVCLYEHDIVIATVGSWPNNPASVVGRTISVPHWVNNALMNQNSVIIRAQSNSKVDQKFIYYQLKTEQFSYYLISKAQGSANQASITLDAIFSYEINWPDSSLRQAIVEILEALDDRITLLRETNATLETIAQALFKSWFVDFDPVHAKQQGREPEGMDADTAALFPDGFDESELVPRGWLNLAFTDTVKVIGGGTPKTSIPEYWNGDIPWFSVADAPAITDVFVINTVKRISLQGLKSSSTKLLAEGTTIISARGTVGRLALVGREMAMNQSCYALRGKADDAYFTYFSTYRLVEALKQRSHGSVFDTITTETMKGVFVIYPNAKVIHAFESMLNPIMSRIKANLEQAQILTTLRDTLLPRLISGHLRLPDAEEAAA